ncbi:MAG TPA: S41 family peptidase [Blastocatellia bacterium]|nr:S41 family peptidase [Blastocatellia bacterium]
MDEPDDAEAGDQTLSFAGQFVSFTRQNPLEVINKSRTLSEFLRIYKQQHRLSKRERLSIIDRALVLLEENYVHLPLKHALHAVDPIQRLRLMDFSLRETRGSDKTGEMAFHQRLLEIFTSVRDIHTMYLLPSPFNEMVAYLPFLVEAYYENNRRRFMVSRVVEPYYEPLREQGAEYYYLEPGAEVLYWNGIPIERAIEINGEKQAGSNPEARFARGLDNLTIRPLDTSLPPDEMWLNLTYRAKNGKRYELRQDWMVFNPKDVSSKSRRQDTTSEYLCMHKRATDHKRTEINSVLTLLYTSAKEEAESDLVKETIKTGMGDLLRAERIKVEGKELGYLRIFTFEVSPDRLVNGIIRILTSGSFPQEGLILDVRGNSGGQIDAGERLLQLFTPRRIKPELFEFINTPLNLEICRRAPKEWGMSQWAKSISESVMTNATYSSGFPITPERDCNDIGQVYYGPVVLITDALSYSATDIFAAGFQDNEIGEILGTSGNTGAGGANVWPYETIRFALGRTARYFFTPLPKGAEMKVALRRSIRVGKYAGRPLEELGIIPDHRHYMTRNDLLNRNPDLIKRAARMLMESPVYRLSVTLIQNPDRSQTVEVSTRNISRLDIYLNDRPFKTLDTKDEKRRVAKIGPESEKGKTVLLLRGYVESNHLVAMCRRQVEWAP